MSKKPPVELHPLRETLLPFEGKNITKIKFVDGYLEDRGMKIMHVMNHCLIIYYPNYGTYIIPYDKIIYVRLKTE